MAAEQETVRAARPGEAEHALSIVCAAFGIDCDAARPLFYQDPFFDFSHKRVLFDSHGEMVSGLTIVPSTLLVGGVPIPVGGIAGVATQPCRQGQGHASRLLAATVGALAGELGYPVSALFPLSYGYYRRFGWETASCVVPWKGVPGDLRQDAGADNVRLSRTMEARQAVRELHRAATAGRTGACLRDARRWRVIEEMSPGRECALYETLSGVIEGYALFERRQDAASVETLAIQEMHGLTPEARRGLAGWLARQPVATLEWPAAPSDLHAFGLRDGAPEAGMMVRICDLPAALALLHSAHFGPALAQDGATLTLRATDALRPENGRPVRLAPGGVEGGSPGDRFWVSADIRQFAQFYMGYCLPSEAAARGCLSASSPEALALADRLFPTRQPYVATADQF